MTDIDGWLVKFYPYDKDGNRMDLKKLDNANTIPSELVRVPFIFEIINQDGSVERTIKMELWAGFMGLKQNPLTFNLKPEIGWAVNQFDDDDVEEEWIKFSNDDTITIIPFGTPSNNNNNNIEKQTTTTNLPRNQAPSFILIDGKEGSINDLSPDDIESFNVLTKEDDIKPYGEKGKNGVILVTLKKKGL
jgi:hypothetical protein